MPKPNRRSQQVQNTKIIFVVQEDLDGGYWARSLAETILVESPSLERLRKDVKKSVQAHFRGKECPELIHLHFIRDEFLPLN